MESKENPTEGSSEVPSEDSKATTFTCSVCGATVVPEEVETPTGIRYKCPECKKFTKPLSKGEAAEREREERGPLPPLQVLVTERVKELLVSELPRVYGIPKKDATKTITAILDTLTSASVMDPWNLHSHIKDFAPNANDRHLESVIEKIFDQLQEEGYLPRDQGGYRPRYDRRTGSRRQYRPGYAPQEKRRERRRYDEEEDYEDLRFRRGAAERRREEEHELRMKKLESEILKITRDTGSNPTGRYEVREFVDKNGHLCDPEKAVSIRVRRPVESKGLTLEDVRRVVREGREEITPEKIRNIIRTETGKGESEDVKALKGELSDSRKSIEDLKGAIETKDRNVLLDKVSSLERTVRDLSSTGIGEWKSDEVRLIKSGISDVKEIVTSFLSGERPLDRAERIITGGPQSHMPPSQGGGQAERGGVIDELRRHGLVTTIVEREGNPGSGSSPTPGPPRGKERRLIRSSSPYGERKEPVGEMEPLREKKGTNTYTEDHIGVVI